MDKLRTAVVGVGHLGRHHARWYNNINESQLVGVYDVESDKCRSVAEQLKVTAFEKLSDLYGKIDVASVAVPTTSHYEVAEQLIKNNIHCLIEKPITASIQEAEKLVALAREHEVTLSVGYIERFNPAVQALKNYETSPRFIEAHRLASFEPDRGTDVAVILDLMSHDIDLAIHLIDSPVKNIDASAVAVVSDTADIANARLKFENGAVANLTASRISLRPMRKLRIFQKSGYFSLDLAEKQADIYRLASDDNSGESGFRIPLGKSKHEIIYNKVAAKEDDMLCSELTSFLRAVQQKTRPEVTAADAVEALRIAAEIDRIGTNGAAVNNG
jgi:predicted dehydrogenase